MRQLVLYAFPTFLPYWARSEDAMKTADSAFADLFYPNARGCDQIANSLVSFAYQRVSR